jgi:DNA-binding SARP family transcriptional activator
MLGSFEIWQGDAVVPGPVGKQRALFALLLLAHEQTVTRARILQELWNGPPPPSAEANMRTYVSQLRAWLDRWSADGPTRRLPFTGRGWSLALPASEVDVLVFEAELSAGRRAASAGDWTRAATHLRRCVDLFRGPALSDVPQGPALAARAAVLNAQRLSVIEEYAHLLLRLGRYAQSREVLLRFLAEHPGRERAWGQLMLACYRDGDLPGALEAYRSARVSLAERLGVEPGAELAELHRAILRRQPEPLLGAPATPGRGRRIVRRTLRRVGER